MSSKQERRTGRLMLPGIALGLAAVFVGLVYVLIYPLESLGVGVLLLWATAMPYLVFAGVAWFCSSRPARWIVVLCLAATAATSLWILLGSLLFTPAPMAIPTLPFFQTGVAILAIVPIAVIELVVRRRALDTGGIGTTTPGSGGG